MHVNIDLAIQDGPFIISEYFIALNPDTFSPSTWWVSRTNEKMDYWGGSVPGSRKCECGIAGQCEIPEKWCNCDSGLDTWLSDEGWLTDMEYLPVRRVSIGDTGTVSDEKQAKHTLGPLICKGDGKFYLFNIDLNRI